MLKWLSSTVLGLMVIHVCVNSGGYVFVKAALAEFTPFAFAFWRFLFGLVGLGVMLAARRSWPRIEKADWPRFLLFAALAVPANQLLYLKGMRYTVPSHASLIYGSTAALVLVLSTRLGYEKLRRGRVIAIVVAVCGVVLVVSESPTRIMGSEGFGGDVLVALSMVAFAVYTVLAKPMVTKYGAVQVGLVCLIIGSVATLPFLVAPAMMQDYSVVTWRGWGGAIYTGIMITAVSYTIWFALLKRLDPSQLAIMTTPQPVVTTALSVLILGEAPGPVLIIGGVMVISGVLLMQGRALLNRRVPAPAVSSHEHSEMP